MEPEQSNQPHLTYSLLDQTELRELKWGTSKAMQIRDSLGRIQPVGAYGEFSLKISKPELLTGIDGYKTHNPAPIISYCQQKIAQTLETYLIHGTSSNQLSVFALHSHLPLISSDILTQTNNILEQYGIQISELHILSISVLNTTEKTPHTTTKDKEEKSNNQNRNATQSDIDKNSRVIDKILIVYILASVLLLCFEATNLVGTILIILGLAFFLLILLINLINILR